jgi:hypothetical protein
MKRFATVATAVALWLSWGGAQAVIIGGVDYNLFDWGLNLDGQSYCGVGGGCTVEPAGPADLPPSVTGTFDFAAGLGVLSIQIGGAGGHSVDMFVDHEIDQATNTFFNEFGAPANAAGASQSWEIDEPGFVFGDIFANFLASTFDNTNAVPQGMENDVSMGLGWDFMLNVGEIATINFILDLVAPTSGFYLAHTDPLSNATIYFSSTLAISPVPAPPVAMLSLIGLLALGASRRLGRRPAGWHLPRVWKRGVSAPKSLRAIACMSRVDPSDSGTCLSM